MLWDVTFYIKKYFILLILYSSFIHFSLNSYGGNSGISKIFYAEFGL